MSAASSNQTTHVAAVITALHGKPVQIIHPPSDGELFDRIYIGYAQVRWPDVNEDTNAIMIDARLAARELYGRIGDLRNEVSRLEHELRIARADRRAALDAFDEQGEEVERLRGLVGR